MAGDAAEGDGEAARGIAAELLRRGLLVLGGVVALADALAEEGADEVGARDVEVGEVGRVGLVQVVVALDERRAGRRDDGLEEGARRQRRRLQVELVEEAAEEADLEELVSTECVWPRSAEGGSLRAT